MKLKLDEVVSSNSLSSQDGTALLSEHTVLPGESHKADVTAARVAPLSPELEGLVVRDGDVGVLAPGEQDHRVLYNTQLRGSAPGGKTQLHCNTAQRRVSCCDDKCKFLT